MKDLEKLIGGFERFQIKYFYKELEMFEQMRQRKSSNPMILPCADFLADPSLLIDAKPDAFVVRNIAKLVPPNEPGGSFATIPAALEFGALSVAAEHYHRAHRPFGTRDANASAVSESAA